MAALQRAAATGSVAGTALPFESNLNADLLNQMATNQALHSFASTASAPGAEAAYLGSFSQLNGQPLQPPLPPLPFQSQNFPFGGGFNAHPYNNSQAPAHPAHPAHPAQTMHGFSTATANIDEFRAMVDQVSAKVAEEAKIAAKGRKIERALCFPSSFTSLETVGLTYYRIN